MTDSKNNSDSEQQWTDPYTGKHYISKELLEVVKAKLKQDPHIDLTPIAGACLTELYKQQFQITPVITFNYEKPFGAFQSSFILIPTKNAVGGMRAWKSMATALDQLNQQSSSFQAGQDLILVAPPPRRDGRIHISVKDTEELVKLIRTQRPDIYEKTDLSLRQGINYRAGGRAP
jgi:hypothetical protein